MFSIILTAITPNGTSMRTLHDFEYADAATGVGEQWIKQQESATGCFSYVVYAPNGHIKSRSHGRSN